MGISESCIFWAIFCIKMCIFSINSLFIGPQVMPPPSPQTPGFGYKLKPNPALCSAHKLEYGSIGPFTVRGFFRGSKSIPVRFWGQKIEGRFILDSLHFGPMVGTVCWGRQASKQRHYKGNKLYILHIVVKVTEILSPLKPKGRCNSFLFTNVFLCY